MKKKTRFGTYIALLLLCTFVMLLLDYLNIPSKIGIHVNEFNLDVQNILINGFITICLFIIAYYLVDRWEVNKHKNKVEIAKRLIRASYGLCKEYSDIDNSPYKNLFIMSRGKNEKPKVDLAFFNDYENIPFENHDTIMQFVTEGILSTKQFTDYYCIKNLFGLYVSMYSAFYNDDEKLSIINTVRKDLIDKINEARAGLE